MNSISKILITGLLAFSSPFPVQTNTTNSSISNAYSVAQRSLGNSCIEDSKVVQDFSEFAILECPGKGRTEEYKPGDFPCDETFHSEEANKFSTNLDCSQPKTTHGAGPRCELKGASGPLVSKLGDFCFDVAANVSVTRSDVSVVFFQLFNIDYNKPFLELMLDTAENYNFADKTRTSVEKPAMRMAIREGMGAKPIQVWVTPSLSELINEGFLYRLSVCERKIGLTVFTKNGTAIYVDGPGGEKHPGNTYDAKRADPENEARLKIGAYMQCNGETSREKKAEITFTNINFNNK